MSYRDKRSRILFATTAAVVVVCPTVSNALPPQAITEEVKACKSISNDQQRLKCYEDLFADKPNQPNATDKRCIRLRRCGIYSRTAQQRQTVSLEPAALTARRRKR